METKPPRETARLVDVAKRAQVSVATVSRVLNSPHIVRSDVRQRVNEAIKELGYLRNAAARALRMHSNRLFGALVPTLNHAIYAAMIEAVHRYRADIGIALDGDADRVTMCDENGRVIDGDQLLGLIATTWKSQGRLARNAVVATVMSNLGLETHLKGQGVKLERTQVGDRYVVGRMMEKGLNVGGEQSGHIVLSDFSTTGDGLIAALQVLAVMIETGKKLSEVSHVFDPAPQKLVNRKFTGGDPLSRKPVQDAIAAAEKALGARGRLLVRKSGTEPLVRVMAQAETESLVNDAVEGVLAALDRE
jgi:phosphoglucosamine mutase